MKIMDSTIRNATELEEALSKLNSEQDLLPENTSTISDISDQQSSKYHRIDLNSKSRISSNQYSTNTLLYNLAGLQTATNTKLDILGDSVLRLTQAIERINIEQVKQTEILATIARNTVSSKAVVSTTTKQSSAGKSNNLTIQQYGFQNTESIVAELIVKLLKQVEIQVSARGRRYRSTRIMEDSTMNRAVKIACKSEFKTGGEIRRPIKMPDSKNSTVLYVASRIGSVDNISPILNAETLRDLFNDTECRTFMCIVQDIMERLCIIHIVVPFYEADMIKSISFPYFDQDGIVLCDWNKLVQRPETSDEALVMTTTITNREKIGALIAKGVPQKAALRAILKEVSR